MRVLMQQSFASGMGYRGVLNITLTDTEFRIALVAGNMVILQTPISSIRAVTWRNGFLSDTVTVNYCDQPQQQKWFSFKTGNRKSWIDAFESLGIAVTKGRKFF
jgi:hypothetical protein